MLELNKNSVKHNIAVNLKEFRNAYELTQKNVSDVLGIDAASYRNWENERSVPSILMLFEIAKMYKVSINAICGIELDENGTLSVASPSEFNKSIYGESKITDLDTYEKQLVMQIRRLTNEDKRKVGECINELLKDNNE